MKLVRIDQKHKFNWEKMPGGGYRVFATIGIADNKLIYKDSNGNEHIETVTEEELFKDDSVQTAWGLPILIGHPKDGRYNQNEGLTLIGSTLQEIHRTDDKSLVISSVITDRRGIELIENFESENISPEISPGYTIERLKLRGDGIYEQINRKYDHLALIPPGTGRGGSNVSLRMDDNPIEFEEKSENRMAILINDQVFDITDKSLIDAVNSLKTDISNKQSAIEELELKTEEATSRADNLETKVKELEDELKLKTDSSASSEYIEIEIKERLDAWRIADKFFKSDSNFDPSLSSISIKRKILSAYKDIDNLDDEPDSNIEFLWKIDSKKIIESVNEQEKTKNQPTRTDIDRALLNNREDSNSSANDPLESIRNAYRNAI